MLANDKRCKNAFPELANCREEFQQILQKITSFEIKLKLKRIKGS